VIPAPYSATTYALFEALGALGTDLVGDAFAEGIADGSVAGVPSRRSPGLPGDQLTVATGNVTPFPNINTLVVNGDLFDALSGDQLTVMHEAAGRTLDAILAGMVGELAQPRSSVRPGVASCWPGTTSSPPSTPRRNPSSKN
jgi:hypothetical protein